MARKIPVQRLAWMAGVVEMRGKIRVVDNPMRRTLQLRLQVQSQQVHVVERLCAMTGVEIDVKDTREIMSSDRRGCVEHCPEAHVHTGTMIPRMAMWAVTGTAAAIVLHNLAEYLHEGTDLSMVDRYLDSLSLPEDWRRPGRGMRAIFDSVNRLRILGWDIPVPLARTPRQWLGQQVEGSIG